jgi:predicted flap endonuclease-1-like 5' DNA nuclease
MVSENTFKNLANLIMAKRISNIEGIGPVFAQKLNESGIKTVENLLEKGATRQGRAALAKSTGIDDQKILKWVNMADLFRIKGVGPQFSELLEAAGVDTVKELRTRNAENLYAKMVEVQEQKNITRAVPALKVVHKFIDQAKNLPPIVSY